MKIKIQEPKINKLDDSTFENALIEEDFYSKRFIDSPTNNLKISNTTFDCCHFIKIDFTNITLTDINLCDSIFEECDLSNIEFTKKSIHRCIFKQCKLVGTSFNNCSLKDIRFINCMGKYVNFYASIIKNTLIQDTDLEESSLMEVEANNLELINSNFRRCEITKAMLSGTNFNTSNIEGITVDLFSLKGIKVSPSQAVELAAILGVIVD